MKVLHVIPSLSLKHGGPSIAMPLIAKSLAEAGVFVDIATTDDDGANCRMTVPLGQRVEQNGYGVFYFRKQIEFYKVSLPLKRWLGRHLRDYEVVHIHALFQFASFAAARCARQQKVPYVIRPLGVLNRWGMENRRRRLKPWSFRFIEKPILRHAAAMHYTSEQEHVEAEQAGAAAKPFMIPLGIDLTPFQSLPDPEKFLERFPKAKDREIILFLSRLDAKKGLDLLLDAFAIVKEKRDNPLLVIAGNGTDTFVNSLRQRAEKLKIADDIIWAGFLDGADKLSALSAARVFALTSHSENFGIALVEALAAGLPCVTTKGVAISEEICKTQAGIVVSLEPNDIAEGLIRVLENQELQTRLGSNGRRLAIERFSMQKMGEAIQTMYGKILQAKRAKIK
jgi:glycosyltransferase involved in cell wall biosynthesis